MDEDNKELIELYSDLYSADPKTDRYDLKARRLFKNIDRPKLKFNRISRSIKKMLASKD